jgi:ribose 5-phosphate isomerase B
VVAAGEGELGVCVRGSGTGISTAANRAAGVRAAVVHDVSTATLAKEHNQANLACFGARTMGRTVAVDALMTVLAASEGQGRRDGRIAKLADLDRELSPGLRPALTPGHDQSITRS